MREVCEIDDRARQLFIVCDTLGLFCVYAPNVLFQ